MLSLKSNQTMHNVIKEIKQNDAMLLGESNQTMHNVEADFGRHLNIIVAIFALTLDKQGNKDFCPEDIIFQAEMVILGHF